MIDGYARALAKRIWFVPSVSIWGEVSLPDIDYLTVEATGGTRTIHFGSQRSDSSAQELLFSELVDHRGNNLPEYIASPVVLARSASGEPVVVTAPESADRVRIARISSTGSPVQADLLVIECGD